MLRMQKLEFRYTPQMQLPDKPSSHVSIDYLLTKWNEYVYEKEKDLREKIAFSVFKKFYESLYGIHSLDSFYKAAEQQFSIDFLGEIAGRKIGLEITEYFDESFMNEERNAIADLVSANLNSKRFISDWFKFSDHLRRKLLKVNIYGIYGIFYFKEAQQETLKLEQNSLQQILFTNEMFFEEVLNEISKRYDEIKEKGQLNIVLEKYSKILIRILCKYEPAHNALFWHSKFISINDFYNPEIIVNIIKHKSMKKYRGDFDDKWLLIYCWSGAVNSFMRQDRIIDDWETILAQIGEYGFSKIYFLSPFYYGLDSR